MGIKRTFTAECDECGHDDDNPFPYSSDLKEQLKKDKWTVNNKLICPICNGTYKEE